MNRKKKKIFFAIATVLIIFSVGLCMIEVFLRLFYEHRLRSEKSLLFRYDKTFGWFPASGRETSYAGGCRSIKVKNNSFGFRDTEHVITKKQRMMVIGDSFVWGADVEKSERFTEKLAGELPGWDIFNLGISGYGTDQEYLLLKKYYDYYSPQIVLLVYCVNDSADNSSNVRYGGYYKPYFVKKEGKLCLQGVPVPQLGDYYVSHNAILSRSLLVKALIRLYYKYNFHQQVSIDNPTGDLLLAMAEFVKGKEAVFIVGFQYCAPELKHLLDENKTRNVDLSNDMVYPGRGYHWTPEGNDYACEKFVDYLNKAGLIKKTVP